jgi:hypothetical protein
MAVIFFNSESFFCHFIPRKSRVKITAVIYCGISITLVPDCLFSECFKALNQKIIKSPFCFIFSLPFSFSFFLQNWEKDEKIDEF